jgi:hypothetical protein
MRINDDPRLNVHNHLFALNCSNWRVRSNTNVRQPLTAPPVKPETKRRWKKKNRMITGTEMMSTPADASV